MDIRLKYVLEDTDRHGNVRIYYRHDGRKIRLRGPTGSVEFLTVYRAASRPVKERKPKVDHVGRLTKGSIKWLCAQ